MDSGSPGGVLRRLRQGDEAGIGLVEVMVSMLLFAILTLMTVGFLVQAIATSARNSTIASATHWAAEQMDLAHTSVAGLDSVKACDAWTLLVASGAPANRTDGRGKQLQMLVTATPTPAGCATASAAPLVSYHVRVVDPANPSRVYAESRARLAVGLQ